LSSWLIQNATIVTVDAEGTVLPRADLLIRGTDIAGLWESGAQSPQVTAEQILDAQGLVLTPGLINTHTHAAMTLLRGYADDMPLMPWLQERIWPVEARLEPDDVYWGTLLAAAEMIRGGVTCFGDMYHHYATAAQAVVDCGVRASVVGPLAGFLPDPDGQLARAIEFAQAWSGAGDGRVTTMLGPHAPYTCPDEMLARVGEAAREHGLGVHTHVAETVNEIQDSVREHGATPVARLQRLGVLEAPLVVGAHCVHLTDEDIAILAAHRVGVAHCPGSNMKLASGAAPVPRLLEAGLCVGLGTDGPASNNNLDVLEEARLAALLHKVTTGDPTSVPAAAALAMATRGGAQALGLGDRVGQIRVGFRADLAVLDFRRPHLTPRHDVVSHLVYAARADDVRHVFVNGTPLLLDGVLQSIDEERVCARVGERIARLMG
jgi:5-methylthioadenosine/S-adenosylhomocysteine deaminase